MVRWSDTAFKFRELMLEVQRLADLGLIDVVEGEVVAGWRPERSAFAMDTLVVTPDGLRASDIERDKIAECGTAACAVGWCSLVLAHLGRLESIGGYLGRVFIDHGHSDVSLVALSNWLFHNSWATIAPRPVDVVRRFDYMLENYDRIADAYYADCSRDCEDWLAELWKEICDGGVGTVDG